MAITKAERRVWAMVPEDFVIASAWVNDPRDRTHRIQLKEDTADEEATWQEAPSWGPFLKRAVVTVGVIALGVALVLLALGLAEGIRQAVGSCLVHLPIYTRPTP